ncbi:hypothetical protein [Streptomyces sp. YIM 98790]|uniref:hypothetical protein n=1 Tax=Streptomyces sp. YIM 98790 TaxID=2689077 RepID=UPI00140BD327|nr:hypothetical protein [Streptomyces sp. YIM 98790]
MPLPRRDLRVIRDPHSDQVIAHGGDAYAHSVLHRVGFVPVMRQHDAYHRLPAGMDLEEEVRRAQDAVGLLTALGYDLWHEPEFAPDRRMLTEPSLGAGLLHQGEEVARATHTQEVADALSDLTAPVDGVLPATAELLAAVADFLQDLGTGADYHHAQQLRGMAGQLEAFTTRLTSARTALADRSTDHPHRRPCAGAAESERETAATCSCPPPPALPPVPPAMPPTSGRPGR